MRTRVRSLASLGGLRIWRCVAVSCGVGHRHGSDPVWLWLWCRLAAAAPTGPLAWEPPYAVGSALKRQKKKKKKRDNISKHKHKHKRETVLINCGILNV